MSEPVRKNKTATAKNFQLKAAGFAMNFIRRGESEHAVLLAGAAEYLCEFHSITTETADRQFRDIYLTELRAALSETDFAEFYEQGHKMKMEEAITLALESRLN